MLKWKQLVKLNKIERFISINNSIQLQYKILESLRMRRYDINNAFKHSLHISPISSISSSLPSPLINNNSNDNSNENLLFNNKNIINQINENDIEKWKEESSLFINNAFNKLTSDGIKWNGNLSNNLNEILTQICKHTIISLLLIDTLSYYHDHSYFNQDFNELKLNQFCYEIISEIDAFTKEKFGACPFIEVQGELILYKTIPSLIHFSIFELLKNSILATIEKYGVLNLDDAKPIQITLESNKITITDYGKGMNKFELERFELLSFYNIISSIFFL